MNENNITQATRERQEKAENTVFNILLIFTALLLAFCFGYYLAINEALALVKTIVN
jgi:phosphate/sulfate permease